MTRWTYARPGNRRWPLAGVLLSLAATCAACGSDDTAQSHASSAAAAGSGASAQQDEADQPAHAGREASGGAGSGDDGADDAAAHHGDEAPAHAEQAKGRSGAGGSAASKPEEASAAGGMGGSHAAAGGMGGSHAAARGKQADNPEPAPERKPHAAAGLTLTGVVVDQSDTDATRDSDTAKYPTLPDVKVCVSDTPSIPCTTTDAQGKYMLAGVPAGSELYLMFSKASYTSVLFMAVKQVGSSSSELPAIALRTDRSVRLLQEQAGITADAAAGLVFFAADTLASSAGAQHQTFGSVELYTVADFTVSIQPKSKSVPVYASSGWDPDPSLKAASSAGWGVLQAAPGDYTLSFEHSTLVCPPVKTKLVSGAITLHARSSCGVSLSL